MKKTLTVSLMCVFTLCSMTIFAANETRVTVNGLVMQFTPYLKIENDVILAPIDVVAKQLEAVVRWNEDTRTTTVVYKGIHVAIQIENIKMVVVRDSITKQEQVTTLKVPAKMYDGKPFLPLEAIAVAFDCKVSWDSANKTLNITTPDYVKPAAVQNYSITLKSAITNETGIVFPQYSDTAYPEGTPISFLWENFDKHNGYTFTGWTVDDGRYYYENSGKKLVVTASPNVIVTANYTRIMERKLFRILVSSTSNGGTPWSSFYTRYYDISVEDNNMVFYRSNYDDMRAYGYVLDGFSINGGAIVRNIDFRFVLTADCSVTVHYTALPYKITVMSYYKGNVWDTFQSAEFVAGTTMAFSRSRYDTAYERALGYKLDYFTVTINGVEGPKEYSDVLRFLMQPNCVVKIYYK